MHCPLRFVAAKSSAFLAILSAFALATSPAPAGAQEQSISWDHAECKVEMEIDDPACTPLFNVNAQPGETITLTVKNTCPEDFEYQTIPLPIREPHTLQSRATCTGTRVVDIRHDPQYGGYVVNIVKKEGKAPPAGNARVTIAVKTAQWKLGFAGGFTANGLTDTPFALREVQVPGEGGTTTTKYRLVTQESREDELGTSVVSFVHLHHNDWEKRARPHLGLSLGIGVEPDRLTDYYLGPSLLFGDRAALTVGLAIGQVNAPPAGREVNDTVVDPNALANLGRKRESTWFIGVSYRFLGGGAADLQKPFAGQNPPGAQTAAATATTPSGGSTPAASPTTADTVRIKAGAQGDVELSAAAGAVVTWTVVGEPAGISVAPASGTAGSDGKAKAAVTVAAGTAAGTHQVLARACPAATPANCSSTTFPIVVTE